MTDDYDLSKKLDGTICFIPSGFTLGGDNSADLPLDEIIKLHEAGQLSTDENGNYQFYKKRDDIEPTIVTVGQGSLCDAFEMMQSTNFGTASLEAMSRFPGYSNMTLSTVIPLNAHPDKQSQGVRELLYVTTSMSIVIQTSFVGNIGNFCNSLTMTYELPSFYDVADESELTETIKMSEFGKVHEHIIHLKGVDYTKNGQFADERICILHPSGKMIIEGNIKVHAKGIVNTSKFETAVASNTLMNTDVVVGSMGTNQVKGRFNEFKKVEMEPVELTDLPDFINDAEVLIDIDNPIVKVRLDNEVPVDVSLSAKMNSYKNGKYITQVKVGKDYGTEPVIFRGATEQQPVRSTNIWVSRKSVTIPDTVESNVVVPTMNELIRTIPDRVEIDAIAQTDSNQVVTLALGHDYKATPSYELVALLKMGPETKVVYTKEINDLHDHLKNMELDGLVFSAEMTNNIPLDLHAVVYPLDKNGKELESIKVNTSDIIPGSSTKNVTFTLVNNEGKDIQKLYKLLIKVYAESSDEIAGQTLNKNQNLLIKHAKITLNGAKYNLNGE